MLKTQTKLVGLIAKNNMDTSLTRYMEITDSIKALEAEKAKLKTALIKSYFESNAVYQNKDGSIVASYTAQVRHLFDNEKFKDAHSDMYEEFSYEQTVYYLKVNRGN